MNHKTYMTKGVCARQIDFDYENGKIYNLAFVGGCNGNLKAISKLCEGKDLIEIKTILTYYKDNYKLANDESLWFEDLKAICPNFSYAANTKDYKKNKESYKGHVGDIAEYLRVALTTKRNAPNLYQILTILGEEEVKNRLEIAINSLGE